MAETGRMAVFHGTGKPFEIREYPVPEPEPGAALIKIALANVCGSDLHYWRGEQDYARMGRPLPLNTGHEHVGTIAKLGEGVTTDAAGRRLQVGDRVAYRYFFPCGRCKACLARHFKSCPVRQANWLVSCEQWPHFQGGFGQYFYLRPNHAMVKLPPEITDEMAAGGNRAHTQGHAGPRLARLQAGQTGVGADSAPWRLFLANRRIIGLAHYEAEHLRGALDLMLRTLTKYPWRKVVSHKYPLEEINRAFTEQDKGHVTRAAIVPN